MRRLLVIKPSSLGDIVHGLQALAVLQRSQPDWHVTWISKTQYVGLIRASGRVDSFISYDRSRGIRGVLRTALEVSGWCGDCVWDLQGLARSGIWTRVARAPQRMGRSDAREFSRWAYTERVPYPGEAGTAHALDVLLEFPKRMGVVGRPVPGLEFASGRRLGRLERFFNPFREAVLVFPESRRPEKQWPGFEDLVDRLVGSGVPVGIFGCECKPGFSSPGAYDGRGMHRIEDLCPLFGSDRLVIANDSGPLHLAAAAGSPTVGIFGPTDPNRYRPRGRERTEQRVVRAPNHRIESLTVDAVWDAIPDRWRGRILSLPA